MIEKFYSVDQVAEMINMHPKTIQKYIREGKLKANKVGKNWRISGHDLNIFTEGAEKTSKDVVSNTSDKGSLYDKIKISAVFDIEVADIEEAMNTINMMSALLNTKPLECGKSTMSAQYIEPELKVRIMVWGNIKLMEFIISFIQTTTNKHL